MTNVLALAQLARVADGSAIRDGGDNGLMALDFCCLSLWITTPIRPPRPYFRCCRIRYRARQAPA